ncbi:MAG: DUF488 family protein [Deltaproteobacteria bacterium]|nr:DUF488 family protein [Deltaproteobacteria bacterium]
MIDRQRIVLELVRRAPRPPSRTHLMKWLFLLREETVVGGTSSAFYDFLPYRYGPFSFVAYRELGALAAAGLLAPDELRIPSVARRDAAAETAKLDEPVREAVDEILSRFGSLSRAKLVDVVYERYPWFASRSELRERQETRIAEVAVYTVGYEGRSVDALLNALLRDGIRRVVDVRKNAFSRKYGFTAATFGRLCRDVDIEYVHLPELGVPSALRADLTTAAAYEKLFDYYERTILPAQRKSVRRAADLTRELPSALMCFEANACSCHRGRLAPRVAELAELPIQHL